MKKPKAVAEMKQATIAKLPAIVAKQEGDELVTVHARITLTRAEWARSVRSVTMAGVLHAVGMANVSTADKVLAQVIATGKELEA